jgi:hypothetical protein
MNEQQLTSGSAIDELADFFRWRLFESRLGKDPCPQEPWSVRVSPDTESPWLIVWSVFASERAKLLAAGKRGDAEPSPDGSRHRRALRRLHAPYPSGSLCRRSKAGHDSWFSSSTREAQVSLVVQA